MRQTLKMALEALVLNNAEWKALANSGDAGFWLAEEQDFYKQAEQAITAIKEALAQPEQEPELKLMPRQATREMLEAMDECSIEGYDERLYAGHASSVYMAAWDAQQPQPERYITDAMKVRQAVAQALLDDVYAEELEQPEAKQSGTISITMPAPIAYLCENATGHKYFRWKKPSSVYKPTPLYTTPPQQEPVAFIDNRIHGFPDCFVNQSEPPHTSPVYLAPPQRKPLTDEQREQIYNEWCSRRDEVSYDDLMLAVEAAHGIKE